MIAANENDDYSSINKLCFFNGYCLAGGCVLTENSVSNKAVQWIVNERATVQDFSEGCIGNSALKLLMNYEGKPPTKYVLTE